MSVSKVKIGNGSHKRSKFDLSHTNNTTLDFGFMQPIFGRELTKDCSIEISIDDFIRLAPMPQPTFSKSVQYKKVAMFVPYEDLYKPFANLISQKPYSPTLGASYVPTQCPYVSLSLLTYFILGNYAQCIVYRYNLVDREMQLIEDYNVAKNLVGEFFTNHDVFSPSTKLVVTSKSSKNFIEPDFADYTIDRAISGERYRFCFNFTKEGKNLRKILIGLGYQLTTNSNDPVNILPLFAYYKAYFDVFYPQRYITWTDTAAYSILSDMMMNNIVNLHHYFNLQTEKPEIFRNFMTELLDCYYVYSVEYFSSQLGSNSLENTTQSLFGQQHYEFFQRSTATSPASNSYVDSYSTNYVDNRLSAMQVWLVERLTKYVNKNTIVGGKISEWLMAHGLGKYVDEHNSNFIGISSSNIQVFDVDSTANTDSPGGVVGNYAGKGVGNGNSTFKFTANCFGYLVVMSSIVPANGFYQGVNPIHYHTKPLEFYHPEFDALGMVSTRKSEIFTQNLDIANSRLGGYELDKPFGLTPRYTEMKVQPCNIINGDMSLGFSRDYLMGYNLDRDIIVDSVSYEDQGSNIYLVYDSLGEDNLANSINWRFCNRLRWQGNYNRIFYNDGAETSAPDGYEGIDNRVGIRDNFIAHHFLHVSLYAPYIPMSHSYITDAEDNGAVALEKQ